MRISAIITCFNEENTIEEFVDRLSKAIQSTGSSFEVILVNDGSRDRTWDKLKLLYYSRPEIGCVVDLFRNSGQASAMAAAVDEARGEIFLMMDSDLQLYPEDIPKLLQKFERESLDVVIGRRVDRKDPLKRKIASKLANIVMRRASRTNFDDLGCGYKFVDGKLIRAFGYGPYRPFSSIEVFSRAGRTGQVDVRHRERPEGSSGWRFFSLLNFFIESLMLIIDRTFQQIGIVLLCLGSLVIVRYFISIFFDIRFLNVVTNGLIFTFVLISFFLTIGMLAFMGELLLRTMRLVHKTPYYIVREKLSRSV